MPSSASVHCRFFNARLTVVQSTRRGTAASAYLLEQVTTIKKSKVDHVIKNGYNGYAFGIGLFTGEYAIINLNQLNNAKFTKGGKEGQLTTEIENIVFEYDPPMLQQTNFLKLLR